MTESERKAIARLHDADSCLSAAREAVVESPREAAALVGDADDQVSEALAILKGE